MMPTHDGVAVAAFTKVLEESGNLQTWQHVLELQRHVAAHLVPQAVSSVREWLLAPEKGACEVMPAKPCATKISLRYDYLVVMCTFFRSLHLVRAQYRLWLNRHQHLIVSDHLVGGPDDGLVGLRWGSSLSMKSLAGMQCAHRRRVAEYDFMLVLDDDSAINIVALDAMLTREAVAPQVPRVLTQEVRADPQHRSEALAVAGPVRWDRKAARLRSKGKDVDRLRDQFSPLRATPCPPLSAAQPCTITRRATARPGLANTTATAGEPSEHHPEGPWPPGLWMDAGFPGGGLGILLSVSAAAALAPFIPGCMRCLTCPIFGAANAARVNATTQRGYWNGTVPTEIRLARDASDRALGFGHCPPEPSSRQLRCAGTDVSVGACWARAGFLTQALPAHVGRPWAAHLSSSKRDGTEFARAVVRAVNASPWPC